MKTTLKSRLRSIIILGFIVVASLFISMWQLFGLHGISAGAAYTQATDIANAIKGAASDWKTKTDIEVGDETNQNGSVVTINSSIVSSIVVPTGAQVTIDSVEPSVQRELENDATYSQLIFDVLVTVSAESVLTINTDVVFRGGVEVYGTLIIGGMAFNQSSMVIANKPNSYAEIDSQGVIVKGSLNNDAARNGSININAGATLTIAESTKTSYTDADGDKNFSNHDGGALFLKADGTSLGLTVDGNIANGGSIIYESGAEWSGTNVIGDGAIVSAAFVSEWNEISGTVVLYPDIASDIASDTYAAGTSFTLGNSSVKSWDGVSLLSFGRTILKNSENNVSYNLTNVNLGGGTSGGKTFTQGANELIFDGGAQWVYNNDTGSFVYSEKTEFLLGSDANSQKAVYTADRQGKTNSNALFTVSSQLNMYDGVSVVRNAVSVTRGSDANRGGGIRLNNGSELNLYGGRIAYNANLWVTQDGGGAGIIGKGNNIQINIYNGKVTRNAVTSFRYGVSSADGAGISLQSGGGSLSNTTVLNMYGGEVSFNHGSDGMGNTTSSEAQAADGGGIRIHTGIFNMYGGAVSNNWTGGFGGGVIMWISQLNMTGGEISYNYAAFGGGVAMTSNTKTTERYGVYGDEAYTSVANIRGGSILGNVAYERITRQGNATKIGGYGGGFCVGAKGFYFGSKVTIGGKAVVSENTANYGGGLAVYANDGDDGNEATKYNSNYLQMSGGTITNNIAASKENGSGAYVSCVDANDNAGRGDITRPLLLLSDDASIDSSNNVSFAISTSSDYAPISVSGELTGSGLAALVYLDNPGSWTDKDIVSYASGVTVDRNKFLLDDTTYTFYEVTSNYLRIRNVENNWDYVASISGKGNYSSLEDAVAAAAEGDTITVLRSATISKSMQVSGKNITIVPASGEDITLGVASDFTVTGTGATDVKSLFIVSGGGSLTIGNNAENTKIAFDGNKSSGKDMSMVYVAGGSFTLGENATLRNNNSTGNAGALYLGQGTSATIKGTIADTSGTYGAIYINAGGSIIIDGATFSGNCSDSNGNNYAVYAVGNESTVTLDGEVAFGGNAVYTENKINLGDSFKNGGATIGVTFPAARTAGTTIVEIPQTFVDGWRNESGEDYESAAQYVSAQFNVVNMDSDYRLILSTQSTTTANALVVSKSVVFVFDFTYSNGFNEGSTQIGISEITFKGIDDVLSQTVAEQFAGRIHTRGNLVVLELQSGSNFPLDEFLGYASRSGHSLISWQVNGTSTKYNYNGNLAYLDSEDEVSVRSVWVENTYNIAFNKNSAIFGQGVTFGGEMDNQEITSNTQDKITLNAYTLVGYAFKEWNTQSDGKGTTYAIDAVANFSQLTADAPVYEYDSSGIITKAVYNITLYAQWECIFSGGEGTAANPFIINSVKDLYILEATVNGDSTGTDNAYAVPNTYYNTNDAKGIATYLPESYEGYYFKLSDNFDNAASPFKGVIGRISSSGAGSKAHEKQEANITAAVYGENATIGGTGAAAGNPFMGYFDGNSDNGKTIALNINKQKVENYTGAEGYENGDETLVGVGLFGYADHATIRNVNLSGSVHGYAHVGGLVGYAFGGNISNIYTSADVTSGGHDVGGVIGTFYEVAKNYAASSVTDAVNIGSVSYAPRERDNLAEELDIEDNWNELGVMDDAQGVRFGGIVGAGVTLRLTGGYNLGNITARYGIGGVVGTLRSLDNSTTNYSLISQSFNTGEITATAGLYASSTSPNSYVQDFVTAYTGGITGRLVGRSSVNTSFNSGKVTSTYVAKVSDTDSQLEYVGMNGFLGIAAGNSATYIGARGVGGIVGFTSYDPSATSQSGRMSISNVYNTGDVYSFAGVGGIAGYLAFGNISEVFNGGNITAYGTHYDAASQSRVNGGYMLSTGVGGETIYVAYLGAIVGRGINASLTATVSFNMNSTYSGYTDPTVQAVGDSGYNAQFGFGANSSSAKALASSQMRVVTQGTAPSGFDPTFDGGAWSFKLHNDTYSYYPQLSVFADSSESITGSMSVAEISRESAQIKYRETDEEQGEVDKPVVDDKEFKLIFNLGGGSFNFSSTEMTDDNGTYSIFTGKHKHYYASGSDYYYLFTFPTDKTDYGTGTEAGGTDELEMPDDPVRTGYTFAGWYIDAGCTQEFNFEAIPGQDTTIYAKWEAVIYTITYENVVGVGGTWSGEYNKTFSILTVDEVRLPISANLSRRGYEFVGWKYSGVNDYITSYLVSYGEGKPSVQLKNSSGSIVAIVAFEDLTAGTLVLTAEWGAKNYTIEYRLDAEGGFVSDGLSPTLSGQTRSYTVASGDIALPEPVRTGYDFTGWKLVSIDGSTVITDEINDIYYEIGEPIGHIRGNTVGNFVLQAVWQINTIRLELDARGGTIEDFESYDLTYDPATGLYYKDVYYYTPLGDVLVMDGKWVSTSGVVGNEFSGWYVSSTASGDRVTEGTPVSAGSGRYTLYAGYKTAEYTITVKFGTAGTTPVTVNDGNKKYLEGLGFVFSEDDTSATLKVTYGYDATEKLSPLSKALVIAQSYYFSSWEVDDGSGSIYNVTGDLTITAEYVQNRVTVNFVGFNGELCGSVSVPVGGSIAGDDQATKDYEALLAEINETTVPGYTFKGEWTYSGNTFDENTVVTSSMVVYAVYEAWDVTVNFYLVDGGKLSGSFTFEGYAYEFGSPFGAFPSMAEIINKDSAYTGYRIDGVYLQYLESVLTNDVNVNTVIAASMFGDGTTAESCSLNLYIKVSKENYSIIFNANGGTFGSATTVSGTYQYNGAVSCGQDSGFPVPTRTGYEFVSWYISGTYGAFNVTIQAYEDYTGEEKYPSAEAYYTQKLMEALKAEGYTGTLNAIANWTEEVYDVWFYAGADDAYFVIPQSPVDGVTFYNEPNGQAVTSGTAKYCVVKTKYDNMPSVNASVTVERKGYTFSGWLTYSNSVVTAVHDDITYTSSTPIKANWTVGRYSIVFITNGGSPVADKNNIAYGENLASVLADVRTTRTGYTPDGWYTDSNLSVPCPDTMPDSTLVLYAKWKEVTNTLTLTITLPAGVTSADSAVKDAVDTALRLESSVSAAENVYTVTISKVKYGTSLAGLNSLNIQVEGTSYAIVGMWQSGSMGVVLGTMPETAYSASATFEVKAEATGKKTVTFYRNDETEDVFYTLTQSGDYIDKSFEGILTPTREGYTFIGWFTAESDEFVFGETQISNGFELYAHWQVNTHTVTYKYNDGATADKTAEIKFGTSLNTEATEDDPSRDGYIFKGWYIDSACTVKATTMPDSDITLYAKWEAVGYKLIFVYYANGDDDTIGADDGAKFVWTAEIGTPIPYPDADIKPYYELGGWYIQGSDEFDYPNMPNLATLGGVTDEDNYVTLTIYAKYSAIEYTVDYIGDDGSTLDKLTVSADTEVNETDLKKLKNKTGYEFVGWNVVYQNVHRTDNVYIRYSVDSKGIYLIAKEQGEDEPVHIGFEYLADIALIAVFKPEEYTLILNANYDGSSTTTSVVKFESVYGDALTTPERKGYSFVGWFTQSEGGEEITSDTVVSTQLVVGDTITLYAQWKANTYYLVFNGNGGTGTIERQTHSYDETFNLPGATSFTRPGYEFSGWKIDTSTYAADAEVSNLTAFDGWTLEVIAQWTPISTTITFNANGGKGEMGSQSFTYGQSVTLTANKFTKEGYHFLGWATPQGSDKVVYVDGATISNITESSLTLYAVWKANTYTVVFNANGGTGTMDPQSFAYGESKALTANVFSRTGYTFLGWAKTNSADTEEFKDEQSVINLTAEDGATVTLYAVWKASGYTVTFDANGEGVTGEMQAQPFTYGQSVTLNANNFEREGYHFLGWATSKESNNVVYADKAEIGSLQSTGLTLYAVWEINTYTVTFNTDGGSEIKSQTVAHGDKAAMPESAPEKDGYKFAGWYVGETEFKFDETDITENITITAKWVINTYTVSFNSDGGSTVDNITVNHGEKVTAPEAPTKDGYAFAGWYVGDTAYDFNTAVTADVELTAKWNAIEYTISYVLNGGTNADDAITTFTVKSDEITLLAPTREGYSFDGWYNAETGGDKVTVIEAGSIGNITLYARWTTESHTVSFNSDGGSTVDNITVNHGEKVTAPKAPTKDGYAFAGWYVGETAYDFNTAVTADVALTAKWNAIEYTISYVLNGGTNADDAITTFTVKSDEITLLAPTREGYSFDGWYNAETGGDKVTVIEAGSIGNITLYARWTTESHTVSFNSDGGSTVDNITVNHGEKVTAPKAPTKDGYAFAGWYVGETAYDFNTAVTADVALTAKWNAIEYTISYVLNGGMNDGEVITEYTIESDTIVHPVPVRDGYTFLGWFDAEVGGNKSETIESGSTGHVTLYAVWRIDSVEVSFEANGGSLDDGAEVQKVDYGNTVAFVEPVRENYLFLGWYTDEALTQSYDFNSAVTQSFTLYAKWRLQQVVGQAPDGTTITVSSDSGFDDGTMLRFTELSDESSISQASGSLTENMTLKRLYDIELVRADGSVVPIEHMLSVGISAEGLGDANGKFVIVYVPDDGGEAQQLATHIGSDGKLYFFIEHFSFYAIVDMTDIVPQAGFAWWWILVAIGGCALIAIIALIIARNNRRYELNYVNGGIPSVKLRESKLIDLPIPERESEVFEGWYYDEDFRDRAFLTSMPKQNLILYAKWRTMTQDERIARDKARAEAAATKKSDDV